MALKKLKVKLTPPAPTKNGDAPIISIEGDLMEQYIKADRQMKDAKAVMDGLRPEILELGLTEIFLRSCASPAAPVMTVKLQDEKEQVVRVQFTKKYSAVPDVDVAEDLFDSLKADINDFVQEVVVPKFNDEVLYDEKGNFDQKRYDAFRTAIERVAKNLGVDCPLETTKVVTPKELFHVERFKRFPDAAVQARLTAAMPNTTQLVPVAVVAVVAA